MRQSTQLGAFLKKFFNLSQKFPQGPRRILRQGLLKKGCMRDMICILYLDREKNKEKKDKKVEIFVDYILMI